MYYEINETTARRAKEMSSFSDYTPGSTTAAYRAQVDEATALAARKTQQYPDQADKIAALLNRYARKFAEYYNKENEISRRCPSVMIAGPANFPVRKKQKQIAAWDKNRENYRQAQAILERIKILGTGGIQSGDPSAIEKLQSKLTALERAQQTMKDVNAYYRRHKTLDGCPGLTQKQADSIKAGWENGWYVGIPFPPYSLQNNNAEIHRIRDRIETLQAVKATPVLQEITGPGYTYRENTEIMRVQFIFDDKPDEATRTLLKSSGFRWAPSQNAWQRQLTPNGRYAAKSVIQKLASNL